MEEDNARTKNISIPVAILIAGALIAGAVLINGGGGTASDAVPVPETPRPLSAAAERGRGVTFTLPLRWGDVGRRLVSVGVIDREKFLALYEGAAREVARRFLDETIDESITVTEENAGVMLNLLWALGLGQESRVLSQGPMADPRYGDPANFAATAGWTVAVGNGMEHYGRHRFFQLSADELALAERTAKEIYRPCCDNSNYFPDCNHGLAMLGLLEFMVSQGAGEDELYRAGLAMNRLWFPDQYEAIDRYAHKRNITDPKAILAASLSSASGFKKVVRELESAPAPRRGGEGGGCSV